MDSKWIDESRASMESDGPPGYALVGESKSITKHHFTLSAPAAPLSPGEPFRIALSAPSSALSCTDGTATITLEGRSEADVMGKRRYQAAQSLNAGLGGGSAALITQRDRHIFFSMPTSIDLSSPGASKGESGGEIMLEMPMERTCECPYPPPEILPSVAPLDGDQYMATVRWKLSADIKRKGLLKRDVHLTLPLTVNVPPSSPTSLPATQVVGLPLRLDVAEHALSPTLNAELTLLPSTNPGTLPFQILLYTYPPPSIVTAADLDGDLRVSVTLNRQVWTKAISQASFDDPEGHTFPSTTSASMRYGKDPGWSLSTKGGNGDTLLSGAFPLSGEEKTVEGCGLTINWSVAAHIQWKGKIAQILTVRVPIALPLPLPITET